VGEWGNGEGKVGGGSGIGVKFCMWCECERVLTIKIVVY